jgi:hypothetical protein
VAAAPAAAVVVTVVATLVVVLEGLADEEAERLVLLLPWYLNHGTILHLYVLECNTQG